MLHRPLLALAILSGCPKPVPLSDDSFVVISLTEPWNEMGLPIGDGLVMHSDSLTLQANYVAGTSAAMLADRYARALGTRGWILEYEGTIPNEHAVRAIAIRRFRNAKDDVLGLKVTADVQVTTVALVLGESP